VETPTGVVICGVDGQEAIVTVDTATAPTNTWLIASGGFVASYTLCTSTSTVTCGFSGSVQGFNMDDVSMAC
jgi:hypothetical protein